MAFSRRKNTSSEQTPTDPAGCIKFSSSQLDSAQKHLIDCNAAISPALADISNDVSSTRERLKELQEQAGLPTLPADSTGDNFVTRLFKRIFAKQSASKDKLSPELRYLQEACISLNAQTSTTVSRRESYMRIINFISSHNLPIIERPYTAPRVATVPLDPDDCVLIDSNVSIEECSYLDSSKFEVAGPKLVILAQMTFNCIVSLQNYDKRQGKLRLLLYEVAGNLQDLFLRICCIMQDLPDNGDAHISHIDGVTQSIHFIAGLLRRGIDSNHLLTLVKGYQKVLEETKISLESLQNSTADENITHDTLALEDEVVIPLGKQNLILKKDNLSWKLLREAVIPFLGISEVPMDSSSVSLRSKAKGGFGKVYDGKILDSQKKVALKEPIDSRDSDTEQSVCLKLLRELYISKKAGDHSNIQKLLGIYFRSNEKAEKVSLVTAWCDGGNLYDYLRRVNLQRRLSHKDRLNLGLQIGTGLAHLHNLGIIHGDLKPDNILIEEDDQANFTARLTDFGISRILDDATGLSTYVHGYCRYQAPEIVKAQEEELHSCVTAKSDVFAFGRVLYECLLGIKPFANLSKDAQVIQHVKDLKLPWYYGPSVGDALCERLMRDCWHRDPKVRPSMTEVVRRLGKIMDQA